MWHRVGMRHPVFTPEHEELRLAVRRFVDTEIRPHVADWEETGLFPDDVFRRCGELGFLGLHYPERWGGSGGDLALSLIHIWAPSSATVSASPAGRSTWVPAVPASCTRWWWPPP